MLEVMNLNLLLVALTYVSLAFLFGYHGIRFLFRLETIKYYGKNDDKELPKTTRIVGGLFLLVVLLFFMPFVKDLYQQPVTTIATVKDMPRNSYRTDLLYQNVTVVDVNNQNNIIHLDNWYESVYVKEKKTYEITYLPNTGIIVEVATVKD